MNKGGTTKICISIGDFNGIGPEVILKSMNQADPRAIYVVLGSPEILHYYAPTVKLSPSFKEIASIDEATEAGWYCLNAETDYSALVEPGKLSKEAGFHAMKAIEMGIQLCKDGSCDALVTAPISKDAVNQAGYMIPGHTEFLAEQTNTDEVLMTLVNEGLRVALVTTHIPIHKVAAEITRENIQHKARLLEQSLKKDFNIAEPKIAAFGLNPHAGDGGIIGMEEIKVITPALEELQEEGMHIEGPFPADGFFGSHQQSKFDAILAMYHDQGLVPFKAISFGNGVNFTAGLPIIRTSPDHGTAFSIAGKGIADESSFLAALQLAVELAEH